jgi:hypothetical protein
MTRDIALIAVLLASPPSLALDRLFYTPAERQALEKPAFKSVAPPRRDVGHEDVEYSGYVRRSDGTVTHWLNGKAAPGPRTLPADLKPGQKQESGRRLESWQAR